MLTHGEIISCARAHCYYREINYSRCQRECGEGRADLASPGEPVRVGESRDIDENGQVGVSRVTTRGKGAGMKEKAEGN